ncbi:MAG: hypothetical protein LBE09_02865 [Christensenellaceae bacterium]|jgi:hypothetical protein|nr:hypothetical protein [Christensenellaceae bacterium]
MQYEVKGDQDEIRISFTVKKMQLRDSYRHFNLIGSSEQLDREFADLGFEPSKEFLEYVFRNSYKEIIFDLNERLANPGSEPLYDSYQMVQLEYDDERGEARFSFDQDMRQIYDFKLAKTHKYNIYYNKPDWALETDANYYYFNKQMSENAFLAENDPYSKHVQRGDIVALHIMIFPRSGKCFFLNNGDYEQTLDIIAGDINFNPFSEEVIDKKRGVVFNFEFTLTEKTRYLPWLKSYSRLQYYKMGDPVLIVAKVVNIFKAPGINIDLKREDPSIREPIIGLMKFIDKIESWGRIGNTVIETILRDEKRFREKAFLANRESSWFSIAFDKLIEDRAFLFNVKRGVSGGGLIPKCYEANCIHKINRSYLLVDFIEHVCRLDYRFDMVMTNQLINTLCREVCRMTNKNITMEFINDINMMADMLWKAVNTRMTEIAKTKLEQFADTKDHYQEFYVFDFRDKQQMTFPCKFGNEVSNQIEFFTVFSKMKELGMQVDMSEMVFQSYTYAARVDLAAKLIGVYAIKQNDSEPKTNKPMKGRILTSVRKKEIGGD